VNEEHSPAAVRAPNLHREVCPADGLQAGLLHPGHLGEQAVEAVGDLALEEGAGWIVHECVAVHGDVNICQSVNMARDAMRSGGTPAGAPRSIANV
jgi:hypothetical protein